MRQPPATDKAPSIAPQEFLWEAGWEIPARRYLTAPAIKLLRRFGARSVLDLGCGDGVFTGVLASQGFEVQGCDASSSGIRVAQNSFPGIPFFRHNLSEMLPKSQSSRYDAVVSLEVIEHLLLPRTLLGNALHALRPGGVFILSTPFHGYWKNLAMAIANKYDDHWHPLLDFGHVKFFSKRTLLQLMAESGFEMKAWLTAGRMPPFSCSMMVAATKRCS